MDSFYSLRFEPEAVVTLSSDDKGIMKDDILCTDGEINNIIDECAKSLVNHIDIDALFDENTNIDVLLKGKEEKENVVNKENCNVSLNQESKADTIVMNAAGDEKDVIYHRDILTLDTLFSGDIKYPYDII